MFTLTVGLRPRVAMAFCRQCHKPWRELHGVRLDARCCTCDARFDWADIFFVHAFCPEQWPLILSRGVFDPEIFSVKAERCPGVAGDERRKHPCRFWTPDGCILSAPARPQMCRAFVCRRLTKLYSETVALVAELVLENHKLLCDTELQREVFSLSRAGVGAEETVHRLLPRYLEYVDRVGQAAAARFNAVNRREVRVVVESWSGSRG